MPDIRGEMLAFETVPPGGWSIGHLSLNADGKFNILSTEDVTIQGIEPSALFHHCKVDLLELGDTEPGRRWTVMQCSFQKQAGIFSGRHILDLTGSETVIAAWDWDPSDGYGPSQETKIYSTIDGHGIAPRFLGHITENRTRAIGFIVEHIPCRAATAKDIEAGKATLARLHGLGIAYGSPRPESLLVVDQDGSEGEKRVLLHGFAGAYFTRNKALLDAEMASLEGVLNAAED
jgi:hypothetical protein